MARQRRRRSASGIALVDVISILAVFPILAALSVPSFPNVTAAYMRREALRNAERASKAADSAAKRSQETVHPSSAAGNNLLTKDSGQ